MVDILIDANNIVGELLKATNGTTGIFDRMTANGDRIAITEQALLELADGSTENFNKLQALMAANSDKVVRINKTLTIQDYEKYARALDDVWLTSFAANDNGMMRRAA